MTRHVWIAVFAAVLFAAAGIALAGNFSTERPGAFFAAGMHKFYVWCQGTHDYEATTYGANAEAAQMKLYNDAKAAGHTSCWPVWQGKVSG